MATERISPIYEAFRDHTSQQLDDLHLNEELLQYLESNAQLISTITRFSEPITIERDSLSAAFTESHYMPSRVTAERFAAQLTQQPHNKLWTLEASCDLNGMAYEITSSANGTVITSDNLNGEHLSYHLPVEAGPEFVRSFIQPAHTSNTQGLLSYEGVGSDPNMLAKMLLELGNRYGYSVRDFNAEGELFASVCRALSVKLMTYESTKESASKLEVNGAIDFGAGSTRFLFSQNNSSEPGTNQEQVSIGQSRIPIDSFLVMRHFGPDLFPIQAADQHDTNLRELKDRLAPLIVGSLKALMEASEEQL